MTAATLVQATSLWTTSPPVAITERLTLPVLAAGGEPAMIVPRLERPGAEGAPGAGALRLHDWADRTDPYAAAAPLLRAGPDG